MNGSVDPNRVVKTIVKMSEYMYERYKLLKKKTIKTYLTVIMIISFSSKIFLFGFILFLFYF